MQFDKGLTAIKIFSLIILLSSCTGENQSSSSTTSKNYEALAQSMASSVGYTIPTDLETDCYFNGEIVLNGNSVTAYQSSSVQEGQICISETRTCTDGLMTGTYNYGNCSVEGASSCLFNGQSVADGESVTAYLSSTADSSGSCTGEVRTCSNGSLSGSYNYANCSITEKASCLFNGKSISHGDSVPAFLTSNVPTGQVCEMEYRTCDDGVLSGSNQFATCEVDQAAACIFNGQTVANGETVTAYLNSSADSSTGCQSETRTCTDGVLSGSNQYASCNVSEAASCLFNGETIAHGQAVTAFAASSVEYGAMCNSESRVCDNGHLSGSYQYASCDAGQEPACLFNGMTIPHGSSVTAYAESSGAICSSEQRTCQNGILSGSNPYASCEVNKESACLFNGQTVESGQSVIAYKTSDAKGHCLAETRTCADGALSGSFAYSSCKTKNHPPHMDDDDMVKICRLVVKIKKKEHYSRHPNNGLHLGWYKFKERYNCGKHLGWYKHKNKNENHNHENHTDWYKHKDK